MIGLSLSFCIKDIAGGWVAEAEVEKIISNTACHNDREFEEVLVSYSQTYWHGLPRAVEIARRFWERGLIEQPRLTGLEAHNIAHGHWV